MAKKKRELSAFEKKLNALANKLRPIKAVEKVFFVDHLKTMLHAGLSLLETFVILEKETENPKFQLIVRKIRDRISKGQQLSEVLSAYPKIFPSIYVKMIEAGETGGKLEESLDQVVTQMKKTQALKSSIRGAMIYPAVILSAMVGIGLAMAVFVLPKLVDIFRDFGSELPLVTRILISVTDFISKPLNLALTLLCTGALIGLFVTALRRVPSFRHLVHKLNLHLPIFGKIIKKINLARFSLTLSSLMKSAVPIVDAVGISADTCTNVLYRDALHDVGGNIKTGVPMSELLRAHDKLFPPMVTEMILVGEKTGEIDQLLTEIATFFNKEVDSTLKNFTTIIEPILILILGVGVGGMAVAVLLPMYNLVQNF